MGELLGLLASLGLLVRLGFTLWTFLALGFVVMLMVASMGIQLRRAIPKHHASEEVLPP